MADNNFQNRISYIATLSIFLIAGSFLVAQESGAKKEKSFHDQLIGEYLGFEGDDPPSKQVEFPDCANKTKRLNFYDNSGGDTLIDHLVRLSRIMSNRALSGYDLTISLVC